MLNDYWTQLFSSFRSMMMLFDDKENIKELHNKMKEIEDWL